MLKVGKYLKKYWIGLLCIVALLYTQAQAELALPDYMSNIITYGIQSGGFDSNVPEMISKQTMDHTLLFVKEEDQNFILKQYDFIEFKNINNDTLPHAIDVSDKSIIHDSGLYVLKDINSTDYDRLNEMLRQPLLMMSGIQAIEKGESSMGGETQKKDMEEFLSKIPKGMSIFDALAKMPEANRQEMMSNSMKQFETLGEATVSLAAAQTLKQEYTSLGVDTTTIQNNYIIQTGILMLGVALVSAMAAILVGLIASRIAAKVAQRMRADTFEKVESFSSAEFNKFSTASLITRTTNDVQQIQMSLVMTLRIVIYSPILAVGAIIRVMNTQTSMVWIIALVTIVIVGIIMTTFALVGPKFAKVQSLVDRLNLIMRESLIGMLVIRAFHNEDAEEKRFDQANLNMQKVNLFTSRTLAIIMPIVMFVFSATSLLIVWVASHEIDLGNMQIGDMIAFMQYTMQIIMSFMMLAMISIILPRASVAAKRVFEVLETPLSIADPAQSKAFDESKRGYVEFNNVCFKYPGAEEYVLKDITFTAKPKQTTAFIGSTGSGKSTIINLVPRFFDVSEGSVVVDGVDIRDVAQHELHDKIGLVPQKGMLFSGTIASNIKYSDEQMSDDVMMEASRIAQAQEFIEGKEGTYEAQIAQGGANVSGGQKQRLSIARAIAKQPDIFIFDDSFSALDYKTDAKLREALQQLIQKTGSTVLLVAQRISSIMHADQIIVLDEGMIVGKGTHDELMQTCEVYQEIAYSQLSKEELANE